MASIAQVLKSFKQATDPLLGDLHQFIHPLADVLPDQRYRER